MLLPIVLADRDPDRAASSTWCWPSYAAPGAGSRRSTPDKQHLHHRLLEIGHSHRRAVLIMWLWAALIAFGIVLVSLYAGPLVWLVAGGCWPLVTVAADVRRAPGRHRPGAGE